MKTHADDYSWYIDELRPEDTPEYQALCSLSREEIKKRIADMEAYYAEKHKGIPSNKLPRFIKDNLKFDDTPSSDGGET